jgi:hypothetical protein
MPKPMRFWPLDLDEEGPIYDNPTWNMPGVRVRTRNTRTLVKSRPASATFAKPRR